MDQRAWQAGCCSNHCCAAASVAASLPVRWSGSIFSPSPWPLRSCITLVVSSSALPSTSGRITLAVDSPEVGWPKLRVCGRPRKASTVASPELAVRGPVSTATGAPGCLSR
ncbi:hypothetical protein G6F58_013052 [Rhizopus delemar]|nr:hypothetical protein G6F58_013052 [Rhizopus delemar]